MGEDKIDYNKLNDKNYKVIQHMLISSPRPYNWFKYGYNVVYQLKIDIQTLCKS